MVRDTIALPSHVVGSGTLDCLVETARRDARQAASENTMKVYTKDWVHFACWCRMHGADSLLSSPRLIGLYIVDLAAPCGKATTQSVSRPLLVSSIERRLSGLTCGYAQRGEQLDRKDRHIASVLAGIRRKHARPPVQKEAILPEDLRDMLAALPRDRAILLIRFAGGLRRSEITSLDLGPDDTPDSGGRVEILEDGVLITLRGKTGWREVEIARGSSDPTCPVHCPYAVAALRKVRLRPDLRHHVAQRPGSNGRAVVGQARRSPDQVLRPRGWATP